MSSTNKQSCCRRGGARCKRGGARCKRGGARCKRGGAQRSLYCKAHVWGVLRCARASGGGMITMWDEHSKNKNTQSTRVTAVWTPLNKDRTHAALFLLTHLFYLTIIMYLFRSWASRRSHIHPHTNAAAANKTFSCNSSICLRPHCSDSDGCVCDLHPPHLCPFTTTRSNPPVAALETLLSAALRDTMWHTHAHKQHFS